MKITRLVALGLALTTIVTLVVCLAVYKAAPRATIKNNGNFQPVQSSIVLNEDISAQKNDFSASTTKELAVDEATFKEISSPIFPNNHEYFKDKNFVYRNVYGELRIFAGVEPKGFELVGACARGDGGSVHYTKDTVHVFCDEKIIPEADPRTFTVIGEIESTSTEDMPYVTGVAKDKDHVYFGGMVINGINPNVCTKDTLHKCITK